MGNSMTQPHNRRRTDKPAPAPRAHRHRDLQTSHAIIVTAVVLAGLQFGGALAFGWAQTAIWWACYSAAWVLVTALTSRPWLDR
jgi:hypothetical protein